MYQPEDNGLALFEVPTARETAPTLAQPPHGCPDTPGRECMLRYLYANKHHQQIKCLSCGVMSSKFSAHVRRQKAKALKPAVVKLVNPKIVKEGTAAERKRKYDREYEKIRRERRKLNQTPEQIEATKARKLRSREKNRDKINAAKRESRARIREAKLAAMTPKDRAKYEQKARDASRANLAKSHAKNAETREAEKIANAERVEQKRRANHAERMEAKRLKAQALAPQRQEAKAAQAKANLELVRNGKKPPNRCEAVTLALEWMLDAGIQEVAMLDFLPAVNKYMHKKVANSGALGKSVRDYGLTVRTEYRGKGVIKAFLFLDDKARAFVDGGFVKHGRIAR